MSQPTLHDLKARLDQLLDDADISNRDTTEDKRAFDETKRNFRSAGPEILAAATEHLWAYYRDVAAEFEPADRAEYGIPELEAAADIWAEVTITEPPALTAGRTPLEPASAYLSFEGEVTWEDEHGLQLVFEEGRAVCKVGPYDGHSTNAHAYNDVSLLGTVFR